MLTITITVAVATLKQRLLFIIGNIGQKLCKTMTSTSMCVTIVADG